MRASYIALFRLKVRQKFFAKSRRSSPSWIPILPIFVGVTLTSTNSKRFFFFASANCGGLTFASFTRSNCSPLSFFYSCSAIASFSRYASLILLTCRSNPFGILPCWSFVILENPLVWLMLFWSWTSVRDLLTERGTGFIEGLNVQFSSSSFSLLYSVVIISCLRLLFN